MKKVIKRATLASLILILLLAALLSPGLPWSARVRMNILRLIVKAEAHVASLKGESPKMVSLQGRLSGTGAEVEALKGARVFALESQSGYTALTDREGRFLIPHITYYPGAGYNLIVSIGLRNAKRFTLPAPLSMKDDIIDLGDISFGEGGDVAYTDVPNRYMRYDLENDSYYRNLFDHLSLGLQTDEQKIEAICHYVSTKHNQDEIKRSFNSPRQVIEEGASLCSDLALAMAAITESGNYPTRTIHTSDSIDHRNTHVTVEVYYKGRWHLYDPTYGVHFLNSKGIVASYKELRLDTDLLRPEAFHGFKARSVRGILDWMRGTYSSGFHQIYQVSRDDLCALW